MTTQPKFSIFLPIFISLLALAASIYSVILTRESHYINKTQILVGKTNELLMLLREVEKLSDIKFDHLSRILTILENNQKSLDKEKAAYNHYKMTMNMKKGGQFFQIDNFFFVFTSTGIEINCSSI